MRNPRNLIDYRNKVIDHMVNDYHVDRPDAEHLVYNLTGALAVAYDTGRLPHIAAHRLWLMATWPHTIVPDKIVPAVPAVHGGRR